MIHSATHAAPGLEALRPLVGKWHTEGQQLDGPLGPQSPFVAVETFEWLDGGHFLIHRLDGKFGQKPAACIELWGRNEAGELFAQTFYNDGNTNSWQVKEAGHALILSGNWSKGSGTPYQLRYTANVIEEGNTLESKWEQSSDGQVWTTFMQTRATKAQSLPNASVGG
jgi:uncharacterized protein DUF1579